MISKQTSDCTKSLSENLSANLAVDFIAKVEKNCRRFGVGQGPLVVAISGGPDSVSLARALTELQATLQIKPLILAHLNHQLRGGESDADELFVADLTRRLRDIGDRDVRMIFHREDVRSHARQVKSNLEKAAREVRYSWLAQVARQEGAHWIATGHTANDQAETILHRLIRGSGLRGLRGIAEKRPLSKDLCLIRPMLDVARSEVMDFLQAKGQDFRQDSSNLDRRLTRNRIRHELLPLLAHRYNPAIVQTLCHLADQAREAYGRVEARASRLLAEAELPRAGAMIILDRPRLMKSSRSLLREVLRLVWSREGWPMARMGFQEWDRLAAVAEGEVCAIDLPGGIRAVARERVVQVGPGQ